MVDVHTQIGDVFFSSPSRGLPDGKIFYRMGAVLLWNVLGVQLLV
jgi:hypothetical protein